MTPLLRFQSLDSTSDEARRQLRDGRALPFAVAANHQSAGRGRNSRPWVSQRDVGLYLTLARACKTLPQPLTLAPLAVGCGVADWLKGLGLEVKLKWPNDLRVDGAKLGGVLCEAVDDTLLVGVGVNWLDSPELGSQPCTSVSQFCASPQPLFDAQQALLEAVEASLGWWLSAGNRSLRQRWWGLAEREHLRSQTVEGLPLGLADDGALRLQDASGAVHEIRAGDVEAVCG